MPVPVRPVRRREWRQMREVFSAMLDTDPAAFVVGADQYRNLPRERWVTMCATLAEADHVAGWCFRARSWSRNWSAFVLAVLVVDDGQLVGEVGSLWVSPDVRRQGLGRSLLTAAHGWCADSGAAATRLWVGAENTGARALYDGLGYVLTGEQRAGPGGEIELRMFCTDPVVD